MTERWGQRRSLLLFNGLALAGYVVVLGWLHWRALVFGAIRFLAWSALSLRRPSWWSRLAMRSPEWTGDRLADKCRQTIGEHVATAFRYARKGEIRYMPNHKDVARILVPFHLLANILLGNTRRPLPR